MEVKAILKENGEVNLLLKEGNLEEVKKYLVSELDSLLDWLDETENGWNDFAELKNNIKEEIEKADSVEDLEQAFEEVNNEVGWWGIYFE